MSKILRRPMFRGGPVDSYGTGIASGLGQPRIGAKRGRFFGDVGNPYTAPLLMDTASVLPPIRRGRIRGPKDFEASRAGTISDAEGLFADASETGVNKDGQEFFGNVEFGIEDDIREQAPKLGVGSDFDKDMENYLMNNVEVSPGLEALRKANIRDANKPSMIEDLTTEKVIETKKGGDDEVEVTMTDLEKALGLDKARRRDLGDMLGRASAAFLGTGDVREGLAEFMAAEAKAGPSRTERIKSIAGLEEFKADRAEKLYDKKLSAQAKLKLGTRGALEKDIDLLEDLPEGSASRKIALKKTGFEPSLEEAIKKLQSDDAGLQRPSPSIIIGMMNLYYPTSFKGVISGDTQPKEDGTYILNDASALIIVEDGVSRLQKL